MNPYNALGNIMKSKYAKITNAHTRFYDEEIINSILKNQIEEPTYDEYH